jgi:alkylation response protein AidB-like acyl-CoA dehydrogenase
MAILGAEERAAFQESVKRLLADHGGLADVRRTMESPEGYDADLWRRLAALGVTGLVVEEAYGGVGAGPEALERVMEAAGAALLCAPLLSSAVLAAGLIQSLGDAADKARLLPSLADGSRIATVAFAGPRGGWTEADLGVTAHPPGTADGDWRLEGRAGFVTDGQIADTVLVVARGPEGPLVFEVDPAGKGVRVEALPTFDRTLRLADMTFAAAPARRLNAAGPVWPAVEAALDLARVALAGEQAGGARRMLDITVDYVKARVQFGRPIGSFQAIKHMAADLLLETESAVSAARAAARSLAEGAPDAGATIALAAFACADAFVQVAATAIQMHGGVAFTWDHPAHLYLRRARADAQLFGPPRAMRERFLEAMGA